jgi:hypothetical protein
MPVADAERSRSAQRRDGIEATFGGATGPIWTRGTSGKHGIKPGGPTRGGVEVTGDPRSNGEVIVVIVEQLGRTVAGGVVLTIGVGTPEDVCRIETNFDPPDEQPARATTATQAPHDTIRTWDNPPKPLDVTASTSRLGIRRWPPPSEHNEPPGKISGGPPRRNLIPVFERFTDPSRRVLVLAQEEARLLDHNFHGTEHLLLGLIHEGEGVAAKALESLGITLETARDKVAERDGPVASEHVGSPPFTPRAKKVMELSMRESLKLGHSYIGTEHLLLGLVREGEGVGAHVLVSMGADLDRVRDRVMEFLAGSPSR